MSPSASTARSGASRKSTRTTLVRSRRQDPASEQDLAQLRRKIDMLDSKIVPLVNERAELASKIGRIKAREGEQAYAPHREREVYARVKRLNEGPLPDVAFQSIYREIMSATIALERPTRVCYFGMPGSFTHLAARSKFGSSVHYRPARDQRDVFLSVTRGQADYGLIPIENSTEGGVNQSIDILAETKLKVCGEIYLPIHLNLLSQSPLKKIKVIYSHPQPFAQCRTWLSGHLGEVERKEVGSTAEAAEWASRNKSAGAIAGRLAAEIYKLPIQAENIEDQQDNITRFFLISEKQAERSGEDKTSLVISVGDEPGALMSILRPFQANGINLTRIESRPSKRKAWEYHFFIDLQGHEQDPVVKRTLKVIQRKCRHLEVLGSYPAASRSVGSQQTVVPLEGKS